jgi:hypothetical protein
MMVISLILLHLKPCIVSKNAKKWTKMFTLGEVVDSFEIVLRIFTLQHDKI